jgi:hypothetical protein
VGGASDTALRRCSMVRPALAQRDTAVRCQAGLTTFPRERRATTSNRAIPMGLLSPCIEGRPAVAPSTLSNLVPKLVPDSTELSRTPWT